MIDEPGETDLTFESIELGAVATGSVIGHIGGLAVMKGCGVDGLIYIPHHRKRLEVGKHHVRPISGGGRGLGDHRGDRVTWHQGLSLDQRITTRDVLVGIRVGWHLHIGDLVRGDDEENALDLEGSLDVDRCHRSVGERTADDRKMQSAGGSYVVDITSRSRDERRVLATLDRRADERGYEGFGGH
jgi:hypothetical protein